MSQRMRYQLYVSLLLCCLCSCYADEQEPLPVEDDLLMEGEDLTILDTTDHPYEEEDWGEGLKVLVTYRPENCEHKAKQSDVIHYHYVGRLGSNGKEFGKSFDYNSPYIVSLGHGRIIAGMDRGLMDTCLWERRRITIPPHLGYGERGVGESIPPNSVLVFYIRMIRIERNGHALGEDERLEDIYETGLYSYSDEMWNQTIDMMEESVRLFNVYENQTLHCLKQCQTTTVDLTPTQERIVREYGGEEDVPFISQFLLYAAKGKCLHECKAKSLPPHLRSLDPALVKDLRQRKPYSYLHYAYYQLGDFREAAKCCFTFHHYNPTEKTAINSIPFYRQKNGLKRNQFISREPIVSPSQAEYTKGKEAYENEKWLEAVDHFESSLSLYQDELNTCRLLCEDVLSVNLTQPDMNEQKRQLFEENSLVPNTMEYYELLSVIIKEVLQCRVGCMENVATMEAKVLEGYLTEHFNYLQYSYYQLGQLRKAAENAATFIAIEPSDLAMANNIRYYKSQNKIPNDFFVPRDEYVAIQRRWETEKRLIYFAESGEVKKRTGQRGDDEVLKHTEL